MLQSYRKFIYFVFIVGGIDALAVVQLLPQSSLKWDTVIVMK